MRNAKSIVAIHVVNLVILPSRIDFDGESLAPVLRGDKRVPDERILIINYSRMPEGFNYPSPFSQSILKREHAAVLWKRWRLLEDRELYDLASDPLQENNVIDRYPDVVRKMRDYLDEWWNKVASTANDVQRIVIGHSRENPMMLTACEWLDVFVDQQWQVLKGTAKSGYWCLEVAEAGDYEFELRRWPKEIDTPLTAKSARGGVALPIATARLFISDMNHLSIAEKTPYGFEGLTKKVSSEDTSVTFSVHLDAGPIALHTWFDDEHRETLASAYYVYVRRK